MYRIIEAHEIKLAKDTGYLYFIDRDHPLATGNSFRVYLHRHLASIYMGYWLSSTEQVHHIDGIKTNNEEDNILVLNASEHSSLHKPSNPNKVCKNCGKVFHPRVTRQIYCSIPCSSSTDIKDPTLTKEFLDPLIQQYSWVSLGKMLGYSDNGIRKRALALGCEMKKK